MEKTFEIDGRPVKFRATGKTLRMYRELFHRDIITDMTALQKANASGEMMSVETLTMFENIAFIMAKQADPDVPDTPDEWLETFEMFSIYMVLPEIVELWEESNKTLSESKKKALAQTGL